MNHLQKDRLLNASILTAALLLSGVVVTVALTLTGRDGLLVLVGAGLLTVAGVARVLGFDA